MFGSAVQSCVGFVGVPGSVACVACCVRLRVAFGSVLLRPLSVCRSRVVLRDREFVFSSVVTISRFCVMSSELRSRSVKSASLRPVDGASVLRQCGVALGQSCVRPSVRSVLEAQFRVVRQMKRAVFVERMARALPIASEVASVSSVRLRPRRISRVLASKPGSVARSSYN
ncbi:MAG: hypothetical protein RL291_306 [Pseudomonadota bacterium]